MVLEAVDELYQEFRRAPEAAAGQIPIVQLTKTIPVVFGKRKQHENTVYAPCFLIVGWTDRVPEMGERTVPPPKRSPVTAQVAQTVQTGVALPSARPRAGGGSIDNDAIPFAVHWQ